MTRGQFALLVASLFFASGAAHAIAGDGFNSRNVIKPNYYQGAGKTLSTIDQEQLAVYRDRLEVQQRAQQLRLYQGSIRPLSPSSPSLLPTNPAVLSRNLFETQSELGRVNGLLQS